MHRARKQRRPRLRRALLAVRHRPASPASAARYCAFSRRRRQHQHGIATVSKAIALDVMRSASTQGHDMRISANTQPTEAALPESLLNLPPGQARESLLAVYAVLSEELPKGGISIYEAGGGSTSFLPLELLDRAEVTVVDIDTEQDRKSDYAQKKVLGDVQTYRFPRGSFDLVTCYNVIEHLGNVDAALDRFCEALKSGGLALIGAPSPRSLSGF